jgi:outer membrane protein assembly factor BamB
VIPLAKLRVAAVACAVAVAAVVTIAVAGCGGVGTTTSATAAALTASTPLTPAQARAAADAPDGDWSQFGYDAQRTGVGPARTGITAGDLGLLGARVVHLPGTVDSSAIQLHGLRVAGRSRDVLVVTTTYGLTLALDARTGAKLWQFTPTGTGALAGSPQITTATPIADPDRRYVYTASPNGYVHKLSVLTGRQIFAGGWPVSITRDPTHEKIASALNIDGPNLIVATGGYIGDAPPYQGHVVAIDRATGRIVNVFNTLCSNRRGLIVPRTCGASDSAIWARAGAVVEPGSGRLLVATGNAPFNGSTNWGDSVLELTPSAGALLHNWTPTDQADLNAHDGDVGSTAPALLGTVDGIRLALQGGKAGVFDLLDLDRLNGSSSPAGPRTGGQLQERSTPGGSEILTAPAVWHHGGTVWIFAADDSGTAGYTVSGAGGHPHVSLAWEHGTTGTSPVLAGGLLYVYDPNGSLGVYEPTTGRLLRSLPAAPGHWNSPIVIGGRIVLPEGNANDHATSGTMVIYHLPGR